MTIDKRFLVPLFIGELFSSLILVGCSSSYSRPNNEFPNMPKLMDALKESNESDYGKTINGSDDKLESCFTLDDLSGWHNLSDVTLRVRNQEESLEALLSIFSIEKDSDRYFVFLNGDVSKGKSLDSAEYIEETLYPEVENLEKRITGPLLAMEEYGKEKEVAFELLDACGIDGSQDDNPDNQRYFKETPTMSMNGLWNSKGNGSTLSGSEYQLIGTIKTPDGKDLYYKAEVVIGNDVLLVGYNTSSEHIEIAEDPSLYANLYCRFDEPYELSDSEDTMLKCSAVSTSPINDDSIIGESTSSDDTQGNVYYKVTDDGQHLITFWDKQDGTWAAGIEVIVNGTVPEEDEYGNENGEGLIEGSFYDDNTLLSRDGARLTLKKTNDGIILECVRGVTFATAEMSGTYYSSESEALSTLK